MNSLVAKGTVVPRRWGSDTRKFAIKRVDKGQRHFERSLFVRANARNVNFVMLLTRLIPKFSCLVLIEEFSNLMHSCP